MLKRLVDYFDRTHEEFVKMLCATPSWHDFKEFHIFKKILSTWEFSNPKEKSNDATLNLRILIDLKTDDMKVLASLKDIITESFNYIYTIKPQFDAILSQHYRNLKIDAKVIETDPKYIEQLTEFQMENFNTTQKTITNLRNTIRVGIIVFDFICLKSKLEDTIDVKRSAIVNMIPDYLKSRFDALRTWFKTNAFLYQMHPQKINQFIELQYKAKLGNIALTKGRAVLGIYSKLLKVAQDYGVNTLNLNGLMADCLNSSTSMSSAL